MENLCIPINKFVFKNQICAVQIQIEYKNVSDWCTNLSLLREGLIQQLVINSVNKLAPMKITLTLKQSEKNSDYEWINPDHIEFALSMNNLGYWLFFFLKGYRDGEFPVDHIDIECQRKDSSQRDLDLTIQVDKYQKPMTKDELDIYLANL